MVNTFSGVSSALPLLREAQRALAEGAAPTALSRLIEAFQALPAAPIAELVDELSAALCRARPPLDEALLGPEYQRAWLDLAVQGRLVDVPLLLPGLLREPLGRAFADRVEHLLSRPPDPRVAAGLVRMIAEPPATAQSNLPTWRKAFQYLAALGDARGRGALEERLAKPKGGSKFWPWLYKSIRELLASLPGEPPPLSEEGSALLDELRAAVAGLAVGAELPALAPAPSADEALGERLLAAIYEQPESLEARLVYADWLTEQGDPRGELIQLQLRRGEGQASKAQLRREGELLKQQSDRWLGDLQPVITPRTVTFARGFPVAAEVLFHTEEQRRRLIGHPAWSTFERIYSDDAELIGCPTMRSLLVAGGIDEEGLALLAERCAAPRLRELIPVNVAARPPATLERLVRAGADRLPALRELTLSASTQSRGPVLPQWRWIAETPLARGLRALTIVVSYQESPAWIGEGWFELLESLPDLEELNLSAFYDRVISFTPAPGGYDLTISHRFNSLEYEVEHLSAALAAIGPPLPQRLRLCNLGNDTPAPLLALALREPLSAAGWGGVPIEATSQAPWAASQLSSLWHEEWRRGRRVRSARAEREREASGDPPPPRKATPHRRPAAAEARPALVQAAFHGLASPESIWPRLHFGYKLRFSPDGSRLAVWSARTLVVYDALTGEPLRCLAGDGYELCAALFHPREPWLFVARRNLLVTWDLEADRQVALGREHSNAIVAAACSAKSAELVTVDSKTLCFWAGSLDEAQRKTNLSAGVLALAALPDGSRAAVGCRDGSVRLISREKGPRPLLLSGGAAWLQALCVSASPDGALLAWGGSDGAVRLQGVEGGREPAPVACHGAAVMALAFSPEGALVVSGAQDGSVAVVACERGEVLRRGEAGGPVSGLDLSPGGVIALATKDEVRLLDLVSLEEILRLT